MVDNGLYPTDEDLIPAARSGCRQVLSWSVRCGYRPTVEMANAAAEASELAVVIWMSRFGVHPTIRPDRVSSSSVRFFLWRYSPWKWVSFEGRRIVESTKRTIDSMVEATRLVIQITALLLKITEILSTMIRNSQ